jgi:hypothetical protein
MYKRIFAAIVGMLALVACFYASVFATEAMQDFGNPTSLSWFSVLGELIMCSMALGAFLIGLRFLRFAWTGHDYDLRGGWMRPLFLGAGLFFPGFLLTLLLGLLWAYRIQPAGKQDESAEIALRVSFFVGLGAAIVGSAVLIRKARHRR